MTMVGTSVPRREDERMLTGRASFLADLVGAARHVVFVRSPHPHARIDRIDVAAALRVPGVVGVFTGADLAVAQPPLGGPTAPAPEMVEATVFHMAEQRLPVLPTDSVCYVGQAVVAVVAVDRYAAEDAAEAVDVDYTPLEFVLDPVEALQAGAPVLHEHLTSNEAARISVTVGDVADVVGAEAVV